MRLRQNPNRPSPALQTLSGVQSRKLVGSVPHAVVGMTTDECSTCSMGAATLASSWVPLHVTTWTAQAIAGVRQVTALLMVRTAGSRYLASIALTLLRFSLCR